MKKVKKMMMLFGAMVVSLPLAAQSNSGAINKVQQVRHVMKVTKVKNNPNTAPYFAYVNVGCSAFALDAYWLVLSGKCAKPTDGTNQEYNIVSKNVTSLQHPFAFSVPQSSVFSDEAGKVMLVRLDRPFRLQPINIVGFSSGANMIEQLGHQFKTQVRIQKDWAPVKTQVFDSWVTNVKDKPGVVVGGIGYVTEPLVWVNNQKQEFLVGYNNADMQVKYDLSVFEWVAKMSQTKNDTKLSSGEWYLFNNDDLKFIKDTVKKHSTEEEAKRVCSRLFWESEDQPYCEGNFMKDTSKSTQKVVLPDSVRMSVLQDLQQFNGESGVLVDYGARYKASKVNPESLKK